MAVLGENQFPNVKTFADIQQGHWRSLFIRRLDPNTYQDSFEEMVVATIFMGNRRSRCKWWKLYRLIGHDMSLST